MGSLFKLREFWSFNSADEECHKQSLVVAPLDKNDPERNLIIVGSLSGQLRIFDPHGAGFRADDVLVEQDFGEPILAVLADTFTKGGHLTLLLLFSKHFAVYSFACAPAGTDGSPDAEVDPTDPLARAYSLTLEYDLSLEYPSYNVCSGNFGGGALATVCVQSLDGAVTFCSGPQQLFTRFLPLTLIPGDMLYHPVIDSLITHTSSYHVVAYTFTTLSNADGSAVRPTGTTGASAAGALSGTDGRKLVPHWSVNIGEEVVALRTAHVMSKHGAAATSAAVVVLGHRTLFILSEGGRPLSERRLDFVPVALSSYTVPALRNENVLVVSQSGLVCVANSTSIVWAAAADFPPVALEVTTVGGKRGMQVLLSKSGRVTAAYLGTDAALTPVPAASSRELDYDALDKERKQLTTQLKQYDKQAVDPNSVLSVRVVEPTVATSDVHAANPNPAAVLRVYLVNRSSQPLVGVDVQVRLARPLVADPPQQTVDLTMAASAANPLVLDIPCRLSNDSAMRPCVPTQLTGQVVVSCAPMPGKMLVVRTPFRLPLQTVAAVAAPDRATTFKVTIGATGQSVALDELFPDLSSDFAAVGASGATFGLRFFQSDATATIILSKVNNRYRVQSTNLSTLSVVVTTLLRRLKERGAATAAEGGAGSTPVVFTYLEEPPFLQFFTAVDEHLAARNAVTKSYDTLGEKLAELRAVQKRLLVRYKEHTPTPLDTLEGVFTEATDNAMDAVDVVQNAEATLAQAGVSLSAAVHLLLILLRIKYELSDAAYQVLKAHLTPHVDETGGAGWEEVVDANMAHLLRTVLAKSDKERGTVPSQLSVPATPDRVKKYIALVMDRVAKVCECAA